MNENPGPSNHWRSNDEREGLFQKRQTKDLVKIIPECRGYVMVESLNEVSELLEEKLGMMSRVMTTLMCNDDSSKVFTPTEILKRVVDDCQGINALMRFQKLKLAAIKREIPTTMATSEAYKEHSLLRRLFPGKRKLPSSPWSIVDADKKKRKIYEMLIGNVYRSVYREFLLFPSPIFKMSEFITKMSACTPPNKFTTDQIKFLVPELTKRGMINTFPIGNGNDMLVVKELRISCIEKHMKSFAVTKEEYLEVNVPETLSQLKKVVEGIEKPVANKVDGETWTMLADIIIATVVKDSQPCIRHNDFPDNLPKAVMKATTTLSILRFIKLCENTDQPEMKFLKTTSNKTVQRLEALYLGKSAPTESFSSG